MNKFIKKKKLIFLLFLLFVYSCGSVGEALQGKKRSDQGDEFLIDKKNPLTMPPDFNIENLLKNNKDNQSSSTNKQSTSIESLILKKIK